MYYTAEYELTWIKNCFTLRNLCHIGEIKLGSYHEVREKHAPSEVPGILMRVTMMITIQKLLVIVTNYKSFDQQIVQNT